MYITRLLTEGEVELAREVFGDSIDYTTVKIHDEPYVWFQPGDSGMTPKGEIHMRDCYSEDYSRGDIYQRGLFIHEMTHVWQFQNKILYPIAAAAGLALKHKFNYDEAYSFQLEKNKDLTHYGMEQQADIIRDYYMLREQQADTTRHERVLKNFLDDPAYARRKRFLHPFRGKRFKAG